VSSGSINTRQVCEGPISVKYPLHASRLEAVSRWIAVWLYRCIAELLDFSYLARPSINHDQAFRFQPSYGR
jgi:hypothetical protein